MIKIYPKFKTPIKYRNILLNSRNNNINNIKYYKRQINKIINKSCDNKYKINIYCKSPINVRNKYIKKRKINNSKSYDNILIKIQVHYMNFIISFINDCIRAFNKSKKLFFKKFNTDIKKKISKMSFDSIKNSTINEILSNIKISRKYKKFDPYYNKVNLNILLKDDWFKKLFGMKFLDLFRYYYNDKEPFNEILLFDKIITLSKDTKPFFKLIERNKEISQRIIEITEIDYLNRKYQIETDKLVEDYSDGNLNQQIANNSINLRNE